MLGVWHKYLGQSLVLRCIGLSSVFIAENNRILDQFEFPSLVRTSGVLSVAGTERPRVSDIEL